MPPLPAAAARRLQHQRAALGALPVATRAAAAPSAAEPAPPHSQIVAMRELYERQNGVPPPPPLAVTADGALAEGTITTLRAGIAVS